MGEMYNDPAAENNATLAKRFSTMDDNRESSPYGDALPLALGASSSGPQLQL